MIIYNEFFHTLKDFIIIIIIKTFIFIPRINKHNCSSGGERKTIKVRRNFSSGLQIDYDGHGNWLILAKDFAGKSFQNKMSSGLV